MNKILIIAGTVLSLSATVIAQPKNWHLLDKETSGSYGISLDKAYDFVKSKKLKSKTVLVAVIDSGIDTLHEDLKPVMWRNSKEIPGNGIDDDKNGYIDDIYGWNFIGGKDGRNVKEDSYEAARVYHRYKDKYDNASPETTTGFNQEEYGMWLKSKKKVLGDGENTGLDISFLKKMFDNVSKSDSTLKAALGKDVYTGTELDAYTASDDGAKKSKATILGLMKANNQMDATNKDFVGSFSDYIEGEMRKEDAKKTVPKNYRQEIVGDDETDIKDRFYGNNDVMASTPFHGTHCSGIIAAARNNNKGMDGIADNVKIMMIRAVPDGDEHDKDIANAIRYAVDNGAQIISMSFGKDFSPEKEWVDDAVKYAESKNVLLVHAAGNDAKDVDVEDNFPTPNYKDKKTKSNVWITVGASGDPTNGGLTASFSNYGQNEVDVFAPGVKIYSTVPGGNTYGDASGTSMACPVVAGIAAFVLEHYPTLSAKQLKYVIEKSAKNPGELVKKPGTDEKVDLSSLSKTGGLVNAFEAIKLASTLKGDKKQTQETLPKPKMTNNKKG
ncbi:MAG: S8 family serine peptidase [Chitinophagaceae bacterium]|nr:S8 family serine peptidase [Chitinophagaceae bacterium]